MSNFSVSITGQKELQQKMNSVFSDPQKTFDPIVNQISNNAMRGLVQGSQGKGLIKTGNTARAWKKVKAGLSRYSINNDSKTEDKKHLIADILNYGHGEILPKKALALYIPLTEKGVNRGGGYKKGLEFGVDFVLAKRVRPVEGTKFIDEQQEKSTKDLVDLIQQKIASVF